MFNHLSGDDGIMHQYPSRLHVGYYDDSFANPPNLVNSPLERDGDHSSGPTNTPPKQHYHGDGDHSSTIDSPPHQYHHGDGDHFIPEPYHKNPSFTHVSPPEDHFKNPKNPFSSLVDSPTDQHYYGDGDHSSPEPYHKDPFFTHVSPPVKNPKNPFSSHVDSRPDQHYHGDGDHSNPEPYHKNPSLTRVSPPEDHFKNPSFINVSPPGNFSTASPALISKHVMLSMRNVSFLMHLIKNIICPILMPQIQKRKKVLRISGTTFLVLQPLL